LVSLALLPSIAAAQPPRLRTLVYDAQKKEWVEQAPPPAGTAEGDLYVIRTEIQEKRYRKALSDIKEFVKKYGEQDAAYPEVLIAKAEALIGQRDYDKAHVVLQAFLGEFAGMAITSEALRLEFEIAETYLTGVKRKVWGIFRVSGEDRAFEILDEISGDYPENRLAELAIKTKADYLFRTGEHALAELEYSRMLREYPRSRYHQFALGRTAESALASFAGVEYDEAALVEASERYSDYRLKYPGPADREGVGLIQDSIRESRAEKEFRIAEYYERTDHIGSAIFYYRLVRTDFPDTAATGKAQVRLELLGALEPVARAEP
jgi:outer membrane protein assembly factor BamD (BamD/ComL family)